MKKMSFLTVLALSVLSGTTRADVVTFNGLVGANGAPFSTYTEGIFTVTPTLGAWQEAHAFGNPVPDIFSGSTSAAVEVTRSPGGQFTFTSVDLGNANSIGFPTYSIQGFLGASMVLSTSGSLPASAGFVMIGSPNTSQALDRLDITMNRGTTSTYNIDNIVGFAVAVPGPGQFALVVVGLVGAGIRSGLRRYRGRAATH
jgi:hypothetical protein